MIFNSLINSKESFRDFVNFMANEKFAHPSLQGEVLLGLRELSRFGTLKQEQFLPLVKMVKANGLEPVLVWDVLQTEDQMERSCEFLKTVPLHEFKRVRVQDPGVLEFVLSNYPEMKIDLILESGNHNTLGLETWVKYVGEQLNRLVLSLEIPNKKLSTMIGGLKKLKPDLEIELLIFGPILLFYTPRPLLKALHPLPGRTFQELVDQDLSLYARGTSEESPHSGFPLIENRHGTFMFNTKDHSLLGEYQTLVDMGVDVLRFDLEVLNHNSDRVFEKYFSHVASVEGLQNDEDAMAKVRESNPRHLIKGFFQTNKTDVLFTHLRNRRIDRKDKNFVGEIVDVERDKGLCLSVKAKESISLPARFQLISPENKIKEITLEEVQTLTGISVAQLTPGEYYLIPFLKQISLKSKAYKCR